MIAVLDKDTIDKIAAGEVIERPASVVKELVENSIDAGASQVTVEIKDGGISLIRITDNGHGIEKEEIKTAFLRHATSKIKTADDLTHIISLGFRGEALSSIAAVTKTEIITKTNDELIGSRYVIEGGIEKSFEEVGVPKGTTFIIRDLFFNTPARKKFLKNPNSEAAKIRDLLEKLALAHPDIAFRFINNNVSKLQTNGNAKLKDTIYDILGREVANALIPLSYENEGIKLEGYVTRPEQNSTNRGQEIYFVNGRYIKSSTVSSAIEKAYGNRLMQQRFPICVLNIQINPDIIDVNVHPNKMEIRFSDEGGIFSHVFSAVEVALIGTELVKKSSFDSKQDMLKLKQKLENSENENRFFRKAEPFEVGRIKKEERVLDTAKEYKNEEKHGELLHENNISFENINKSAEFDKEHLKTYSDIISDEAKADISDKSACLNMDEVSKSRVRKSLVLQTDRAEGSTLSEKNRLEKNNIVEYTNKGIADDENNMYSKSQQIQAEDRSRFSQLKFLDEKTRHRHRIVGQVFGTYWIVEFEERMYIIDQHAAHEKVIYERFLKQFKEHSISSQLVSPPIIYTVNSIDEEILNFNKDFIEKLGFEIEEFGLKEYKISAIPNVLPSVSKPELLKEIIEALRQGEKKEEGFEVEIIISRLAQMACKAAVKGNTSLSYKEADILIGEMLSLDNPYNCPHGRPTIIEMTKAQLEKKFKRIV